MLRSGTISARVSIAAAPLEVADRQACASSVVRVGADRVSVDAKLEQFEPFAVEAQRRAGLSGIGLDAKARGDDRRGGIEIELELDVVDAPRGRAIVAQENGRLGAGGRRSSAGVAQE